MTLTYLESRTAVEDYARLAFESKGNIKGFQNTWRQALEDHGVEITQDVNEDEILPKKIIGAIEDALGQDKVFEQFHPTFGIEAGEIVIDPKENADGAWGHTALAEKKIQSLTLEARNIMPKAIYKLQRLDHMTYLKGGALVNYVLTELPRYVVKRISQAILVGGVKNEDGTTFNAVYPIIGDSLALETSLPANYTGDDVKERLIEDLAEIESDNPTVFISPKAWAKLALTGDAWSVAMFTGGLDLGGNLVRTTALPDNNPLLIVDTNEYFLGFSGTGIETLSQFVIMNNAQVIESRAYVAGSLKKPLMAIYATVAGSSSTSSTSSTSTGS